MTTCCLLITGCMGIHFIAMDKVVVVAELDHASRWWNLPTLSEAGTLSSSVYDACGVTPVWKWTSKCIDTIDWWQGKVGTVTYKFCNVDQWKKKGWDHFMCEKVWPKEKTVGGRHEMGEVEEELPNLPGCFAWCTRSTYISHWLVMFLLTL